MGTSVLESGIPIQEGLHVYAHSLKGIPGGVAILVINTSKTQTRAISFPEASSRFTLSATAQGMQDTGVLLNGRALALGAGDSIPTLTPSPQATGSVSFDPETITFLTFNDAGNHNE